MKIIVVSYSSRRFPCRLHRKKVNRSSIINANTVLSCRNAAFRRLSVQTLNRSLPRGFPTDPLVRFFNDVSESNESAFHVPRRPFAHPQAVAETTWCAEITSLIARLDGAFRSGGTVRPGSIRPDGTFCPPFAREPGRFSRPGDAPPSVVRSSATTRRETT